MRIGVLAEQLGLNPRTIRYYEQIGLIPAADRTSGGYRDYGEADADRLEFVRRTRRLGFGLEAVAEIISLRERGDAPCSYVRGLIDTRLAQIDERIQELQTLQSELVGLRAVAEENPGTAGRTCRIIEHTPAPDGGA